MSTGKSSHPTEFDLSVPDGWPAWKKRFSRYRVASELASKGEKVQISTLLYCMGPDSESVFAQLKFSAEGDEDKRDKVVEQLDTYFQPGINIFHQQAVFEQCVHLPGESVEEFMRKLHDAADHCKFGAQKDKRIRDRFVHGAPTRSPGGERAPARGSRQAHAACSSPESPASRTCIGRHRSPVTERC